MAKKYMLVIYIYIYIYMSQVQVTPGSWCNSKQYYTTQYFLIGFKF